MDCSCDSTGKEEQISFARGNVEWTCIVDTDVFENATFRTKDRQARRKG
jgi:hypothetical protein